MAQVCGFFIPRNGLRVILINTFPVFIHPSKICLCTGMFLFCSFFVPEKGLYEILLYTFTVFVHPRKCILSICIILFCRFVIPVSRLYIVFSYAFAEVEQISNIELRSRVSLRSKRSPCFDSSGEVSP